MNFAYVSTIFPNDLPNTFQGSRLPEEPLDILYSLGKGKEYANCEYIDVWDKAQNLKLKNADVIILSTTNSYIQWNNHPLGISLVRNTIDKIKSITEKENDLNLIVYGPHVPAHAKDIYKMGAKAVFIGEAELVVNKAAVNILNNKEVSDFHGYVDPISLKAKSNAVINNMDELPTPAYEFTVAKNYWAHNTPNDDVVPFGHLYETSRGCPFMCSFCNTTTHRRKYRTKSNDKIKTDLLYLSKASSKKYVYLIDESFSYDFEWFKSVSRTLKELPFQYGCQGNLKFLSKEKIDMMADSNFISLEFGFESGDVDILKGIGKENRLSEAAELLNYACTKGISPLLFTLIGLPGETENTLQNTLDFFSKLSPEVRISISMPTPYLGTRLYKQGVKEGLIDPLVTDERIYSYTGRVGHKLNFKSEDFKEFQSKYGPNNYLTPTTKQRLGADVKSLFQLSL
jgi:radical SAM superfamily enzyme YgiQ (UPF0313 family)